MSNNDVSIAEVPVQPPIQLVPANLTRLLLILYVTLHITLFNKCCWR